jgi:hypothetical protein
MYIDFCSREYCFDHLYKRHMLTFTLDGNPVSLYTITQIIILLLIFFFYNKVSFNNHAMSLNAMPVQELRMYIFPMYLRRYIHVKRKLKINSLFQNQE